MIWVLSILGLYLLALFGVSYFSLHPVRTPVFISPGAMGEPQEEVEFSNEDGLKLRGWWLEKPNSTVVGIYCHGYLMNRCELTPLAVELAKHNVSALLFDFPAHGKSQGKKCHLGWRERNDVKAAVAYARSRMPNAKVFLVGSSMGAAACAFALADDPNLADALLLDSAYSNMAKAVSGWWRFIGGKVLSLILSPSIIIAAPMAGFNPFKVDVSTALSKIEKPTLILHGDIDNLATPGEATRNAKAAAGPVEVVWFKSCGHSEGRWVHPELYYESIINFLRRFAIISA
ncbi:MAG TPA: alpha/beta hydrolase [Fimbriimonadaceae bacterium]|jgi:pimeloyl-ACP methyl ester carboxylesterase